MNRISTFYAAGAISTGVTIFGINYYNCSKIYPIASTSVSDYCLCHVGMLFFNLAKGIGYGLTWPFSCSVIGLDYLNSKRTFREHFMVGYMPEIHNKLFSSKNSFIVKM